MNNLEKVRSTFARQGFPTTSKMTRVEFDQFLNLLMVTLLSLRADNCTTKKWLEKFGNKLEVDKGKSLLINFVAPS